MPRALRIERVNGIYHVINRGNYRQDLFVDAGAHEAFERCLFEACHKCRWELLGHCVMTNHFHLVIRTPEGNLIYGMKWLQATFANRYHRFRKVHGKLFQGRYKSLIVDESAYLGPLLHYVHLNPVRAGLCPAGDLPGYRWSSFWYLHQKRKRPAFMDLSAALDHAGGLKDTPAGRRQYQRYLAWLAETDHAQKEMAFEKMSRGWALGTKDFKRSLLKSEGLLKDGSLRALKLEGRELAEANTLRWESLLEKGLSILGKTLAEARNERKSAAWKVWIARVLKTQTSAPNVWIAERLQMGAPQSVSVLTSRLKEAVEQRRNPAFAEFYRNMEDC